MLEKTCHKSQSRGNHEALEPGWLTLVACYYIYEFNVYASSRKSKAIDPSLGMMVIFFCVPQWIGFVEKRPHMCQHQLKTCAIFYLFVCVWRRTFTEIPQAEQPCNIFPFRQLDMCEASILCSKLYQKYQVQLSPEWPEDIDWNFYGPLQFPAPG